MIKPSAVCQGMVLCPRPEDKQNVPRRPFCLLTYPLTNGCSRGGIKDDGMEGTEGHYRLTHPSVHPFFQRQLIQHALWTRLYERMHKIHTALTEYCFLLVFSGFGAPFCFSPPSELNVLYR